VSPESVHLLVHQDEYVFPPFLQQGTVELPPAGAPSSLGTQELLKFLDHGGHLLPDWLGPQNWRDNLSPHSTEWNCGIWVQKITQ
jgi:hypothetical protein